MTDYREALLRFCQARSLGQISLGPTTGSLQDQGEIGLRHPDHGSIACTPISGSLLSIHPQSSMEGYPPCPQRPLKTPLRRIPLCPSGPYAPLAPMTIWIDADACPNVIKEILFRAARRVQMRTVLVANHPLTIPGSDYIEMVVVKAGLDVADGYIVEHLAPGDLVITADIPLAAAVVERGGYGLNPRGDFYDASNIRERLTLRNFMEDLRTAGVETGGPAALNQRDRQAFANRLDRFLTQHR